MKIKDFLKLNVGDLVLFREKYWRVSEKNVLEKNWIGSPKRVIVKISTGNGSWENIDSKNDTELIEKGLE